MFNLTQGKCYSMNLPAVYMETFNVPRFWTIRQPHGLYFYNEPFIILAKENDIFIKILYKGKVHFMATYDWMIFSECNVI